MRLIQTALYVLIGIVFIAGIAFAQGRGDMFFSVAVGSDDALYLLYGPAMPGDRYIAHRADGFNTDLGVLVEAIKIRIAPDGTIYAVDPTNGRVLRIRNGEVDEVVGRSHPGLGSDPTAKARFTPLGLAVDAEGNVYIGDTGNGWLLMLNTDGELTRIVGVDPVFEMNQRGNPRVVVSSTGIVDGPGESAKLLYPEHLAIGPAGGIYIAESTQGVIRLFDRGILTTIAGMTDGDWGVFGMLDGPAERAKFGHNLSGLAVDRSGNIFVMDIENRSIRQITWDEGKRQYYVYTLAGSPKNPGEAKDGIGFDADFGWSMDMNIDSNGNLYIVGGDGLAIRKVTFMAQVTTINAG